MVWAIAYCRWYSLPTLLVLYWLRPPSNHRSRTRIVVNRPLQLASGYG